MQVRQYLAIFFCLHFISCSPSPKGGKSSLDKKKEETVTVRKPATSDPDIIPTIPAPDEQNTVTEDDLKGIWRNSAAFELDYTGLDLTFFKQTKILPQAEISKCSNFIPIPGISVIMTELELSIDSYSASLYHYKGTHPDTPELGDLCLWKQKTGEFNFIQKFNLLGIDDDFVKINDIDEEQMTLDMRLYNLDGTLKK